MHRVTTTIIKTQFKDWKNMEVWLNIVSGDGRRGVRGGGDVGRGIDSAALGGNNHLLTSILRHFMLACNLLIKLVCLTCDISWESAHFHYQLFVSAQVRIQQWECKASGEKTQLVYPPPPSPPHLRLAACSVKIFRIVISKCILNYVDPDEMGNGMRMRGAVG